MFGNLSQLMSLMRNAGQIKQSMEAMQERLAAARFVGEAGAGQVRATVDGKAELVEIRIDPALARSGDVEMLEDLVCAAVRDAAGRSRDGAKREMEQLAGGMGLSGVMDMLGGAKP